MILKFLSYGKYNLKFIESCLPRNRECILQVFGNILKNINTPNVGNIGYVLVVGGVYLLLIYLVIMTLFIGMKKVFKEGSEYQFNRAFTWRIIGTSAVLVLSGLGLIVIHEFCLT